MICANVGERLYRKPKIHVYFAGNVNYFEYALGAGSWKKEEGAQMFLHNFLVVLNIKMSFQPLNTH